MLFKNIIILYIKLINTFTKQWEVTVLHPPCLRKKLFSNIKVTPICQSQIRSSSEGEVVFEYASFVVGSGDFESDNSAVLVFSLQVVGSSVATDRSLTVFRSMDYFSRLYIPPKTCLPYQLLIGS